MHLESHALAQSQHASNNAAHHTPTVVVASGGTSAAGNSTANGGGNLQMHSLHCGDTTPHITTAQAQTSAGVAAAVTTTHHHHNIGPTTIYLQNYGTSTPIIVHHTPDTGSTYMAKLTALPPS